ncbi:MAG: CTP-dependent riboflavin kinase [Candidatus Lokiarchaeota archaeon]|nr:CTP-dependent riboflavin kinase [Candidatus Lokiarchaeota archaeon]
MTENTDIDPDNYANWFALFYLCQRLGKKKNIRLNSTEFGDAMGVSQQTASRRIQNLEELNWIKRKIEGKTQIIDITELGTEIMLKMYRNLKLILENVLIAGEVSEGMGEGGYYVAIKEYYEQFEHKLGFEPYKGTLNLNLDAINNSLLREKLEDKKPVIIEGFKDENRNYGEVKCFICHVFPLKDKKNKIRAAILDIQRTHHGKNIIEILASPYLRDYYDLKDGDKLIIELS